MSEEHPINEDQPTSEEQPTGDEQPAAEDLATTDEESTGEDLTTADEQHTGGDEQPTGEEDLTTTDEQPPSDEEEPTTDGQPATDEETTSEKEPEAGKGSILRRRGVPLLLFTVLVGVPLVLLILVAWGGLGHDDSAIKAAPGEKAPPKASATGQATQVSIVLPKKGKTVSGSTVRVRVKLNGELVPRANAVIDPTEGLVHLHFQLDGGKYDTPAHSNAKLITLEKSTGSYSGSVIGHIVYRDIPPGEHALRVELVNNDHNPGRELSSDGETFQTK
jgi:hypothetical protein